MARVEDPTGDEMRDHLLKAFEGLLDPFEEGGAEFDREGAIYWFATNFHGGQSSNLYSALSTSDYRPGMFFSGPEPDSQEEMMYQELVATYAPDYGDDPFLERQDWRSNPDFHPRITGQWARQHGPTSLEVGDPRTARTVRDLWLLFVDGRGPGGMDSTIPVRREFYYELAKRNPRLSWNMNNSHRQDPANPGWLEPFWDHVNEWGDIVIDEWYPTFYDNPPSLWEVELNDQGRGWKRFSHLADMATTWDYVVEAGMGNPTEEESRAIMDLRYYGEIITKEGVRNIQKGIPFERPEFRMSITSYDGTGSKTFSSKEELIEAARQWRGEKRGDNYWKSDEATIEIDGATYDEVFPDEREGWRDYL